MWYDHTVFIMQTTLNTFTTSTQSLGRSLSVCIQQPYMCTLYLVDLSLLSRHPLDSMFCHLLLLLFGVLLGNVGKGVVGLVVATIKVIPGSVQTLQE